MHLNVETMQQEVPVPFTIQFLCRCNTTATTRDSRTEFVNRIGI